MCLQKVDSCLYRSAKGRDKDFQVGELVHYVGLLLEGALCAVEEAVLVYIGMPEGG